MSLFTSIHHTPCSVHWTLNTEHIYHTRIHLVINTALRELKMDMMWCGKRYDMRLVVKYIIYYKTCVPKILIFVPYSVHSSALCTVYGVVDESYYSIFTLVHISTFIIYFTWILECIISCFAAHTLTLESSKWYQIHEQIDEPKRIKRGNKKTRHDMQIRPV